MSQATNTYDVYLPKVKQQVLKKLIVSNIKNGCIENEKTLVNFFKNFSNKTHG